MQLDLIAVNLPLDRALRERVERRAARLWDGEGDRPERLVVRVGDAPAARVRCRVELKVLGRWLGREVVATSVPAAIDRAFLALKGAWARLRSAAGRAERGRGATP